VRSLKIRSILLGVAGLLAISQAACGANEYTLALRDATDSERAFQDFETRAIIRATLCTAEYRAAWVNEYARLYSLNAANTATLRETDIAEAGEFITVIASFHTQEQRWNSLNPADGLWEVRIESERGDFARPVSVRRLDKNNPLWERLYPYNDRYSILYELRFDALGVQGTPLMTAGTRLHLIVSGAPAQMRLTWEVR